MSDPYEDKARRLREAILRGPAESPIELRADAFRGVGEGPVGSYVAKVRRRATDVADADVEALRAAGLSDGRIFEVTVAAAAGAGFHRLDRVLELLRKAS